MKFPYMRRDTKLSLIIGLGCAAILGLAGFGLGYDLNNSSTLSTPDFSVILLCSIVGLGLGGVFEYVAWASFIEEYGIDKRHERYRTVKTY